MKLSVPVAKVPSATQTRGPNWRMPDVDCALGESIIEAWLVMVCLQYDRSSWTWRKKGVCFSCGCWRIEGSDQELVEGEFHKPIERFAAAFDPSPEQGPLISVEQ